LAATALHLATRALLLAAGVYTAELLLYLLPYLFWAHITLRFRQYFLEPANYDLHLLTSDSTITAVCCFRG
jgi:hypothetical protein